MDCDSDVDSISSFLDETIDLHEIDEFNASISKYKDFYKENVETIKLKFLFINKENKLEKIKQDDLILKTPNIIYSEDLIKILISNRKCMNKSYNFYALSLYNVDIDPENISVIDNQDFLCSINYINKDIHIQPTINILQDLNELLFIFKENNTKNNNNKSKKIKKTNMFVKTKKKL